MTPEKRAAWLEWRRGGIGASDVAAILGLSKWSSAFDVWASKVHGLGSGPTAATERGHMLEEAIMKRAKPMIGARWHSKGKPSIGPESWQRCTPDYTLRFGDGREELIECKSTRDKLSEGEWEHEPPDYYRLQCQWQMLVTGFRVCHLPVWSTMTDEFRVYRVERNDELLSVLVPRMREWWERHVVGGERPPMSPGKVATEYLLQEYGEGSRRIDIATESDEQLVAAYQIADREAKDAKARRDELADALKDRIGEWGGLKGDFGVIKVSRAKRRKVDWKAWRTACPSEASTLDQYTDRVPQLTLNPRGLK